MLLKTSYLLLSIIMTIILLLIGFYAINQSIKDKKKSLKSKAILLISFTIWHLYLFIISNSGLLEDFSLPPRLPIFIIIPLFTFSGLFIYRNRKKEWIQTIPNHWLVYYQSFRIGIETIFYFSVGAGILPALVTFEGYNYDILFGFSSLIIGYLVFYKKVLPIQFIRYWNITGIIVIIFIIFLFVSGTYFPNFYSDKSNLLTPAFTQYPYILVAGFLMPSAVFIHLLSLANSNQKNI